MIACQKMTEEMVNDLDQELFSELTESLVQPLLVHMVPPFAAGKDENYCLQINQMVYFFSSIKLVMQPLQLSNAKHSQIE